MQKKSKKKQCTLMVTSKIKSSFKLHNLFGDMKLREKKIAYNTEHSTQHIHTYYAGTYI